jgi:ribosome-associated translation inhibitor RaiA
MLYRNDLPVALEIDVATCGQLPGIEDYVREKIGGLIRVAHEPVLYARVKLSGHTDPAVTRPIVAQANLDVNGRPVRAQVHGENGREAVDRLEARLWRRLERLTKSSEVRRGNTSHADPHEWRHDSEPTDRPRYYPRPFEERRIIRRKSFTLGTRTLDEAAQEMEVLDYDFHLFTEKGTGQASVLYRPEPSGYRLAQVLPLPESLAPYALPVSISRQPAARLTVGRAKDRLDLLGLPFLFFIDVDEGRAGVLYHRYDGHYGTISPAG